ncbi:MAG: maleamate amidohydrolase [Halieaceae bacterium]|jgi:maleamate amidohydrolase
MVYPGPHALPMGRRPALLLVNVIEAFTDPQNPLGSFCDGVLAACTSLLDGFRSSQLPVCFSSVVYLEASEAPVFRARLPALNMPQAGHGAVEIDSRLRPQAGEHALEECYASAFCGTDLKAWLVESGVDSLVVCGLTAGGCVRATVVDGLEHNYPVWVPKEAVGDRNELAHAANLHDLHAKYAEVVSLAATLHALEAPVWAGEVAGAR